MKIFVAVDDPFSPTSNPYISTLINAINELDKNVLWEYGNQKFWKENLECFDIIYIHWPDAILRESKSSLHSAHELELKIQGLKSKGVKIVATCHNMTPHYCNNKERIDAYNITYQKANLILHLGEYSQNILSSQYTDAKHVLLPHHIYDSIYNKYPTKEEAISKLGLKKSTKYILCFGAFRHEEERCLLKELHNQLYKKDIEFLVPSFIKIPKRRNKLYIIGSLFKYHYTTLKYKGFHLCKTHVDDKLLPYYYAAADIALIHRVHILNSGNVPLGFLMKKVVVGPNIGNVGPLLQSTGNPTFIPTKIETIIDAINLGFILDKENKGKSNYQYAMDHFSTKTIASQLYQLFVRVKNGELTDTYCKRPK